LEIVSAININERAIMSSVYFAISAWREILARIFTGFEEQDNVTPTWLVNPATNRRLKLDKLYPQVGVAIRFVGLTAKGQGRQSDWEAMETEQRDQTRIELCRQNGVQLATLDPADEMLKQMDALLSVLARASRTLAQGPQPAKYKAEWMPALAAARDRAEKLRSLIAKNPEQMLANLAEGWRDREAGSALELRSPEPAAARNQPRGEPLLLAPSLRVRHLKLGDGVVTRIDGAGDEAQIYILFDGAGDERRFQANLIYDKLELIAS
jgi:hypothetical protein